MRTGLDGGQRGLWFVLAALGMLAAGCLESKGGAKSETRPERADGAEAKTASWAVTPETRGKWKDGDVIIKCGEQCSLTYADMREIFAGIAVKGDKALDDLKDRERQAFFRKYYHERLFAAEARERGLQNTQAFLDRTLAQRYRLLIPVYKQREIVDRYRPTDEEVLQYLAPAQDEVQVRVVVKSDEADARRIYERAARGENFEQLARTESEGHLRDAGGLTGFLSEGSLKGKFPPPVIRRFLETPTGAILEPFFQDIGFLIVKVEAKRTAAELRALELDRRRAEIVFRIHSHYYDKRLEELRSGAKVVIHEDVLSALEKNQGQFDLGAVLVEVNGKQFRAASVLGEMANAGHGGQPVRQRAEGFVEVALVGGEAMALGIDKDPLYREVWQAQEQKALSQELMRVELERIEKEPLTDEEIEQYRKARPEKFVDPEARHLRVIVCDREAAAADAIARLRRGDDFAEVAKTLSVDPNTKEQGGDMGYLVADAVPEVIRAQVFSLGVGAYTDPPLVATSAVDGTRIELIVKVEGVREAAPVTPNRVKSPRIENEIRTLKRSNRLILLVKELEAKHRYEYCLPSIVD